MNSSGAALEAKRYGHGGIKLVNQITGLDEKIIPLSSFRETL